LDALSVVTINGITATQHKHEYGFEPPWAKHLHEWSEAATATLKETKQHKVKNKGKTLMFVGYPDNHIANSFWMWDPDTKRPHKTSDIIFLRRMFYALGIRAGEGVGLLFDSGNPFLALNLDEPDPDPDTEDPDPGIAAPANENELPVTDAIEAGEGIATRLG
jgi:hypothetical protein